MRSVGVESGGTWIISWVHLHMGSGEPSCAHSVKAVCFGVGVGGLVWWASAARERSSARFQFFCGGLGHIWGKTLGSALDHFPGSRTVKEWVVREESSFMRRIDAIAVKRDASGRYFCLQSEKRRRHACLL